MPDVKTTKIDRDLARKALPVIDEATKEALARLGLEAFRFDADVCAEEGWMRLKIKIRPVGQTS